MNHKNILIPVLIGLLFSIFQPVSAMDDDYQFQEKEKQIRKQVEEKPYGCWQKKGGNTSRIPGDHTSNYKYVCIDGMTDEQHKALVIEFEPYINSALKFIDSEGLWGKYKADILKLKTAKKDSLINQEIDDLIAGLKVYENQFIKKNGSDSDLRKLLLKKAQEIDPVKEKQKQQAKKKQALADKKKKEKLIQDTIVPFAKYINQSKYEYVYNVMQEHYIKQLASVDDPTQSSYDHPYERLDDILGFAQEFADYILINGTTEPTLVVKKGMEDTLREAIMKDVEKRYPEVKTLYQQTPQ